MQPPINFSKVKLTPSIEAFLSQAPKFAPELPVSRVENLAAVHEVAAKIPEANRQDFISAGSWTVCSHGGGFPAENKTRTVIKEFRQANLSLLDADKEGDFVVVDKAQLEEKAAAALFKNFSPLKARPSVSLRTEAKALSDSLNPSSLKSLISSSSQQYLSTFFSAKAHKPGILLRCIVFEKGCCKDPWPSFCRSNYQFLTSLTPSALKTTPS